MYKLARLDIWMVYTMSFKENFTRLCNQKRESPTTVCKKLGLSNAAYSCWTDESIPRKSTLIKIADYFGVSVDFLLGKKETPAEIFWNKYIELCANKSVSPNAVAKKIGMSSEVVIWWKRGRMPQNATLKKIADYFGVPVNYFLTEETDRPSNGADELWEALCKSEKKRKLAMWIMSLPDDELDRAEKLLDAGKLFPPDHS